MIENIQYFKTEQEIETWLKQWAELLNSLLTNGVTNISSDKKMEIKSLSENSISLGFTRQGNTLLQLLTEGLTHQEKAQFFFQSLVQQDMIRRLYSAEQIYRRYVTD